MLFDQDEAKYRREGVGVNQAEIPELVDFCEHTRFRTQVIESCESNQIPTTAIRDDIWWRRFLEHFSEVECVVLRAGTGADAIQYPELGKAWSAKPDPVILRLRSVIEDKGKKFQKYIEKASSSQRTVRSSRFR
jgi:hypothetical protein